MMKFLVLKASFDGICGGDSRLTIEEACSEISWSRGWNTLEELRDAIRRWGKVAKAGSVFKAAGSAIVATR